MAQAKEISERTTGGMGLALSYDASAPDTGVSWPFVWYLRDYTNQRSFDQPTKGLRDSVFVIVDAKNFDKIDPALGPGYYRFDYIRMWWPSQDYFGLTRERIADALRNKQILEGIWDIWFDRDYTRYAAATGHTDLTPSTWQPADQMRLYIRKDVAAQIWNYGAAPVESVEVVDPTEGKGILLDADLVIGEGQAMPASLNAPRSLAFAPDGTFYVADSRNHRIVHFSADGRELNRWGSFADGVSAPAPPGTFNEPWGIAVGPDGSVYVSDTWNHRIQKFTSDGQSITAWGQYGQTDQQYGFWGPRGLAVDASGKIYVADTGNKRIIIFDANGTYLTEFGSAGLEPGQFDEPVGVAVGEDGTVFVTDTWNQRVQTFKPSEDGINFIPDRQWDVFGWYGQSLDNKPFIAVNAEGHVFVTDPEQYRVIEFTAEGEVIRTWGDFGDTPATFGLASGIAVDPEGHIWVTDGLYNRILRFTMPNE
jgi:DNA-binding beta-propeller fold protein YncE